MIRFILLDIEGTTTEINFVHQVLFPYAAERLADFVNANARDPEVQQCLTRVKETVEAEDQRPLGKAEAIETLLHWIQTDRKHTALKQLQGMIWKTGFEQGDTKGTFTRMCPWRWNAGSNRASGWAFILPVRCRRNNCCLPIPCLAI